MICKKRKGISEILSAVILIIVVVSGMAIYTALSQERIFENMLSVNEVLKKSEDKAAELITNISVTRTKDNTTAYLMNYGSTNVTIANLVIGNKTLSKGQFNTYLLSDAALINPQNRSIPSLPTNSTVKLFVKQNFTDSIIVITESEKIYEIRP